MNYFAVHLKLIQHCNLTILSIKRKKIKLRNCKQKNLIVLSGLRGTEYVQMKLWNHLSTPMKEFINFT